MLDLNRVLIDIIFTGLLFITFYLSHQTKSTKSTFLIRVQKNRKEQSIVRYRVRLH